MPPQELKEVSKDNETSGLKVTLPDEADLMKWVAEIKGPLSTPYEGGIFKIAIELPSDYPFVPPKVRAASSASTSRAPGSAPPTPEAPFAARR